MVQQNYSPHAARKQRKGNTEEVKAQGHTPSDPFLSTKTFLLKFLEPPKIVLPAGDLSFNT
jgi:hypothetical protein